MIGTKKDLLPKLQEANEDDIYELTKKNKKSVRSLQQNKYWHSVICKTISDWSGDSTVGVHYMLKQMFNLETTTDLKTDEFAFMCKTIIDLFKENYGVIIPLPNDIKGEESLFNYIDLGQKHN